MPSSPVANSVNWRISVPATNASPAPRRMKTRICVVRLDLVARARERVVHRPRHGVARVGAIECQECDGTVGCEQHLRSGHDVRPFKRTVTFPKRGLSPFRELSNEHRPGALDGIRVLDVTQVMAGPFCAMQLCDMGADVIKVEPPEGDSTRHMAGASGTDSPGFNAVNRGKRGIVLDLKTPAAQEAFRRLARRADILIENYRPGVMRSFGLDYASLAPAHPGLIYASISGYGQTGPDASRGGFDLIAQGASGLMSVTGEPGRPPVKVGVPLTDLGAGLFALSPFWRRCTIATGPDAVSTSIRRSSRRASRCPSGSRREYFASGATPGPLGSAHRMFAPYQAIRCADGFITLGAANDRLFQRLCELLGHPEWIARSGLSERDAAGAQPRVACRANRANHRRTSARALAGAHSIRSRHPVRTDQRLCGSLRQSADPRARHGRRGRASHARTAPHRRRAGEDVGDAAESSIAARRFSANTRAKSSAK